MKIENIQTFKCLKAKPRELFYHGKKCLSLIVNLSNLEKFHQANFVRRENIRREDISSKKRKIQNGNLMTFIKSRFHPRTLSEEKNSHCEYYDVRVVQPNEIRICPYFATVVRVCTNREFARNRGKRIEVAASLTLARSLYPEIESAVLPAVIQTEITRL